MQALIDGRYRAFGQQPKGNAEIRVISAFSCCADVHTRHVAHSSTSMLLRIML